MFGRKPNPSEVGIERPPAEPSGADLTAERPPRTIDRSVVLDLLDRLIRDTRGCTADRVTDLLLDARNDILKPRPVLAVPGRQP